MAHNVREFVPVWADGLVTIDMYMDPKKTQWLNKQTKIFFFFFICLMKVGTKKKPTNQPATTTTPMIEQREKKISVHWFYIID